MRKKTVKIVSVFYILLLLFSGCKENNIPVSKSEEKIKSILDNNEIKDKNNADTNKENDHLKVLCNNNIVLAVNELIDFYCEENEISKEIFDIKILNDDTVGDEEYFDMIFNDISNIYMLTDDSNSDVMTSSEIGFTDSDLSVLYSGVLDAGRNSEGNIKAFPVIIQPVVFCYRDDIAADFFDYNEKDMQEAVENWNNFRYTATDIFDKTDNDIKICTLNEIKDNYTYPSHLSFLENNKLVIDDKVIEGYEYIKEFFTQNYASEYEVCSDEWKAALKNDEIFGFFADFYDEKADRLNEVMNDEYIRWNQSWKCVKGPDCMIKKGVWVSVGRESLNNDKAKEFISFYTQNDEKIKKYALSNRRYMSNSKVMKNIIENEEYTGVKWIVSQSEHLIIDDVASSFEAQPDKTAYDNNLINNYRESLDLYINSEYSITEDALDGFIMMSENYLNENGVSVELITE